MVLVKMLYKNNHFISRIEKVNNGIETVITYNHAYINETSDVIYINNKHKPLWIEIIHDINISNGLRYSMPIFFNNYLKAYGFRDRISKKNSLSMFKIFLKRKCVMTIKKYLKYNIFMY